MRGALEPIAIIGTGCRFPGDSTTPSKLWDLLREPQDVLETLTKRFNTEGWYHCDGRYHGHANVQQSYQLAGQGCHRRFDAQFFGINAVEASTMDPQIRLLLETVYEALEAAGQPIESLRGSDTAVFAGMMIGDYKIGMERDMDSIGTYHVSGVSRAMMANRLSYFFDWHGPSMTIDTACSSSMIAVHQAVMQLRSGNSRVAIAAGSNLLLDPVDYVSMSKLEMLSPEGRSRMWDKGANGYARGEGVAAVVLKTLKDAEADGDYIECVIRETATNQDGRTPGITVPNAVAQAQLMRDCYARAGLDPIDPSQRPQYFEAHGTGTRAGDPVEAEAIQATFFADDEFMPRNRGKIFVGSIKSVLGHAESAAGLAGLIKASLALQHSTVPPNLLFNEISPSVEPHYKGLHIPTTAVPWPVVPDGAPRRASVNSFGFGGSNAHVILESYTPIKQAGRSGAEVPPCLPYVFSAASETSLASILISTAAHLRAHGAGINMRDLALTLYSRRSRLPFGTAVFARNTEDLCISLEEKAGNVGKNTENAVGSRPLIQHSGEPARKPKVLGVFTGQGAQSVRMGASLIEQAGACERIIDRLESRLGKLPEADRPSWSLKQELLKGERDTRTGQAVLSQPLCTALQILQVELLRAAGVELSAVVGHSSGEIGAAYCAGIVSAEDAICIAYYRGLYSDLTGGPAGAQGAMLAVGTSIEDARELCDDEEFQGRVSVAAINSSTSLTLSGDSEAIDKMKLVFEDEGKFVRYVKVDKAYHHPPHMKPCANAYLQSLHKIGIQSQKATIPWFSSVNEGKLMADEINTLKIVYWADNMVKPVMFKQAVEGAWESQGPFDLAIEIGPHPALRAPTLQIIQDTAMHGIPYTGVQDRGKDAVECFANALGYIWTHLGTVDLSHYDMFFSEKGGHAMVTGLPPYSWDHEKEYWHESRYSNAIRTRSDTNHDLLGHLTPDTTDQDMRWRNILRPKDLTWLKDHALHQQAVFPAAGYVVCAVEAAAAMARARGSPISFIEVLDLDIAKALTFDPDESGVETISSLSDIQQHGNHISASFKFNASPQFSQGPSLALLASGRVRVQLGEADEAVLPTRCRPEHGLSQVEAADFYASLEKLEYQYEGPFRSLFGLERRLGFATGYITREPSQLLLHPAVLDAAFQSLFLAHCAPNSGALWSLHVPRTIRAVRLNPYLCATDKMRGAGPVAFDCVKPAHAAALEGDIDMFPDTDGISHAMVQIEGLHCVPLSSATAQDGKSMFATMVWEVAAPDGERVAYDGEYTAQQLQLARLLDRMAVFFLRRLDTEIPQDHPARSEGPYQHYFRFALHMLSSFREGKLPLCSPQWEQDTLDDLLTAYGPYLHIVDVQLLKAFGDNILEIATGRTQAIEVGMKDGILSKMYQDGLGLKENTIFLARLVGQIVHRYPHMNILEVGAGTGGATKVVLSEIRRTFSSYTYTDISSGFFDAAQEMFASQADKMLYKVLDIGKDIRQQGYSEHSYDLVIASAVLHATPSLQDMLRNVRRLLRPGGFLVVLEIQPSDVARMGTIFGALPGWWLGAEEGRVLSPCVHVADWDNLLHMTGFSGCDTVAPVSDSLVMPLSVFVSQAVDSRVRFMRDPLAASVSLSKDEGVAAAQELVLLGGKTFQTSTAMARLRDLLRPQWGSNIRWASSLADLPSLGVTPDTAVLSLLDLDEPVFKKVQSDEWEGLKGLLQASGPILWVTSGRRAENPHANMMVGLLRSAREEIPTLDIQSYDIEDDGALDASELATALLRWKATTMWHREGYENILMTVEPEVVRQRDGSLVIPRLIPSKECNDRYNSSRRSISATADDVSKWGDNIGLVRSDEDSICLRKVPLPREGTGGPVVRVSHSSWSAIRVSQSGLSHIALGLDRESGQEVVALTQNNSLIISPITRLPLPASVVIGREATFVALLAYRLIAHSSFKDIPKGATVIVHEPNTNLAVVLADEAEQDGIQAVFTTTSTAPPSDGRWLHIHPLAPERAIRSAIPQTTIAMFDFSEEVKPDSLGSRLRAQLPRSSRYHSPESAFSSSSAHRSSQMMETQALHADLQKCVSRTLAGLDAFDSPPPTVTLDALGNLPGNSRHVIIDWSTPDSGLSVLVQPADAFVQFPSSSTYWLAGLSGGLGLLLCEWMASHGARYFVISSRSPVVPESWLDEMGSMGAVVKVLSCDITNISEVEELLDTIHPTLPAVAGVCQGAMVLQDTAIREMSLDTLVKVTKPKVEGSLNLDRVFQSRGLDLDFFIFFSSVGSIVGRPGQSNYAAANLFMTALAEQRRQRGQAASVMHIGPIFGAGYITQQRLDLVYKGSSELKHMFPISEHDFFQHFSEAVMAQRSSSQSISVEQVSGVTTFASQDEVISPLFGHHTHGRASGTLTASTGSSKASLKLQLEDVRDRDQLFQVVQEAFLSKLNVLFQLELCKLEQADPQTLRLEEMGIDSLIAVEIRGWFVKTLQVNVPILKILSGSTVHSIIEFAVETIPRSLVPKLKEGTTDPLAPEQKQASTGPPSMQTQQTTNSSQISGGGNQHPSLESLISEQHVSGPGLSSVELTTTASVNGHQEMPGVVVETVETNEQRAISEDGNISEYRSQTTSENGTDTEPSEMAKVSPVSLTSLEQPEEPKHQSEKPRLLDSRDERLSELSFSQSLFWFSATFSDNPSNLNLTASFSLVGEIRIEALKRAVLALGKQHEALRTCFFVQDGRPMQGVMHSPELSLEHYSIQHEGEMADYGSMIHNHVYDLQGGRTIRLALLSLSSTQHFFIIGVHHLAMDGQSFFPLMQDLLNHYTNRSNGVAPRQYATFSDEQLTISSSGGFNAELAFWKAELVEMPPPLPILRTSTLASRPTLQGYGNRQLDVKIGSQTKALIQALCRRCGATPFHFYLAVLRVLLYRYTGSTDFSIGIGDANRTQDQMGSIGNFVNLLPLVFHTEAPVHFDTMLQETRLKVLAALANSRVPFQLLLQELDVARSAVTTPIFQAFMDYRLARGERMSWGVCQLELRSFLRSKVAYDISVDIIDNADGDCRLTFIVRDDLYTQADVEQISKSYVLLANTLAAQPTAPLGDADFISREEMSQALDLGRGSPYKPNEEWGSTVIHRIDTMADKYPTRPAVLTEDGDSVSYGDIVHHSVEDICAQLQAVGVTTDSRVAVLQEPTPDWISSILAVMRLGATYLPLDIGTPWSRLTTMVKDCQPLAILVSDATLNDVERLDFRMQVVNVSDRRHGTGNRVPISATSNAVSTILYTSGSSGVPKGILLIHRGMQAWLESCQTLYDLREIGGEVLLQQSSQGFDMSLMQIFTALCFGGSVCLLPRAFRGDALAISELITRHHVTHTYGTPSEYFSWLKYGDATALKESSWKTALVGGEPLGSSLLKEFATLGKGDLRFHHMYGTTESTFCAAVTELDYVKEAGLDPTAPSRSRQLNYPAGMALPNYSLYILDEQKRPLPAGLQGEVYIGGAGVALGYLNNPALTATTFISDPFATPNDRAKGWNMMQRTGDLGRWSLVYPGAVLIEGRISGDTMVKLRGLRVDLREVEIALLRAAPDTLSEAIVSVRRGSPDSPEFLVAHVVLKKSGSTHSSAESRDDWVRRLRAQLELPLSIRPAHIIVLEALPMTSSGKLDRRTAGSLPIPKTEDVDVNKNVVWTKTEERLKTIWEMVLGHSARISLETDFFHVGGTSLSLLSLRDKINAQFTVKLKLLDLFEASVLSEMACRIEGKADAHVAINWQEETRLAPSLAAIGSGALQEISQTQPNKVVILTGGTGHLGKILVLNLIKDATVGEIHCLGVRNAASRVELNGLDKVTLYEGDLTQPRMGLSQPMIEYLFSRAHLIIHNGADVSYMKTYRSMRQSNFQTTRDLVEWSMPRMIPFHFISTAGIGNLADDADADAVLGETSMASTPPPTDGTAAYTACKWASEVYLENLTNRYPRWPVCVHRPTLIRRDDIPQLDGAHNIIGYSRLLGAVPKTRGVARGAFNVVDVDAVVDGVLDCVLRRHGHEGGGDQGDGGGGGGRGVHFVNHVGKLDLPLHDMRKWVMERTEAGYVDPAKDVEMEQIPLDEWIGRAIEMGMHPTMGVLLTTFARNGEVNFPIVTKGDPVHSQA